MINIYHCTNSGAELTCASGVANFASPVSRGVELCSVYEYGHGQAAASVDALLREPPCLAGWHRRQTGVEDLVN